MNLLILLTLTTAAYSALDQPQNINTQGDRVDILEALVLQQSREMEKQTQEMEKQTREMEKQSREMEKQKKEIEGMKTKMLALEMNTVNKQQLLANQVRSPKHSGSVRGAFHAAFTPHHTTVTPGAIIPFDNVQYNTGEYNPSTGVFSCPVTGLYVFYFTVHIVINESGALDLMMDSSIIGRAAAGDYNNADHIGIHYCNQYQDVYVSYVSGNNKRIFGNNYSSFGGFLLYG
eukprot:GHVU01076143.1.p1 GENE.GHVU01076143.1~~GHVU01076143.1.p1  ORF type:complete len:232 (+),score=28.98 GHVU01076143.1:58-753(+)